LLSRRLDFQLFNFSKFKDIPQLLIPNFLICFKETTKSRSHWNPKFEILTAFLDDYFAKCFSQRLRVQADIISSWISSFVHLSFGPGHVPSQVS
jgi:hypothetical protein